MNAQPPLDPGVLETECLFKHSAAGAAARELQDVDYMVGTFGVTSREA